MGRRLADRRPPVRFRGCFFAAALAALGVGAAPKVAWAQEGYALAYEVPPPCPSRDDFVDLLRARLGSDPFDAGAAARLRVVGTANGDSIRLVLDELAPDGALVGTRALDGARGSCAELVTSLAVVVGILLEEARAAEATEPVAATSEDVRPPSPARTAEPSAAEQRPASAPRPLNLRLAVGAVGALGRTAGPSAGGGFGVALTWGLLRVELGGRAGASFGASAVDSGDRLAMVWFEGRVGVGVELAPAFVGIALSVGSTRALVETAASPQERGSLHAALGVRGGLEWEPWPRVGLRPFIEVAAGLARPTVEVAGESVWSASPLQGILGLDVFLRLD